MPKPKVLSRDEIKLAIKGLDGWKHEDNKISKEFKFASFSAVARFIINLAPFCNYHDHHPDIHIYYNKAVFDLTRYDVGEKLTDKDFLVAHEIEERYKNL